MRTRLAALVAGTVFGAGLALADMTNPLKVQNFLDVAGAWDASLAFVMGAALVVAALGYRLARRREAPWLAPAFALPTRSEPDAKLVTGAALFGVGWGLGGLCPGPALAGLLQGVPELFLFALAMVAGVLLHDVLLARRLAA